MVYLCVAIRGDSSEGLLILRPGASAGGVGEAKWSDGGFSLWFTAVEDLPATVWKGGESSWPTGGNINQSINQRLSCFPRVCCSFPHVSIDVYFCDDLKRVAI